MRISRKRVNDICNILGYTLITHQELGDRKDYWYLYSVTDANKNVIIRRKPLRFVYDELVEKISKNYWIENNTRHFSREFAVMQGIIDASDTTTNCVLWFGEYVYIHDL